MCGRYTVPDHQEWSDRVDGHQLGLPGLFPEVLAFRPTWNAAPSQQLPVIVQNRDGQREARLFHWGLLTRQAAPGSKAPRPINARIETIRERPMFRRLLPQRRCLVPATGYYEWMTLGDRKEPWALRPTDQTIFAIAGLYDAWLGPDGQVVGSFCLLTVPPAGLVREIHDRMPAILRTPEEEARWISRSDDVASVLELARPYPDDRIAAHPVSMRVNNVRNDGPELVDRITGPDGRVLKRYRHG
jgi:putative SOS response-associated peptidase YedK